MPTDKEIALGACKLCCKAGSLEGRAVYSWVLFKGGCCATMPMAPCLCRVHHWPIAEHGVAAAVRHTPMCIPLRRLYSNHALIFCWVEP